MGLPVAIPAATSAFGGAMAASTVLAPALMSAAAVTGPMAALTSFSPALISSGGGGLFGSMGGLLSNASFMDIAYGASNLLSGIQTIRQGQIQKDAYKIQELTTLANIESKMLNFQLEGLDKLKKLHRIQAANMSKAYAGGSSGLDGSAALMNIVSDQEYGKDYAIELMKMKNELANGKVQAGIYADAGPAAVTGSYLDATAKLGESAYLYKRLGGAPAA